MMRARNRHSASNYLFAAFLELVIMAIFVVIAQPELRESLFKMFEPPAHAVAAPSGAQENSAAIAHNAQVEYAARAYVVDTATPNVVFAPTPVAPGAAFNAAQSVTPGNAGQSPAPQNVGWSPAAAGHSPLEQYESFAVSTSGAGVAAMPASVTADKRVAGYAPAVGATQLHEMDWNIASAAQSPRPLSGWSMSGWTKARPAEEEYRGTYPPPYGTQSQWK